MSPSPADSPLTVAQDALARGEFEEARAAFERFLEDENTAEAHEGLSWAALGLDDGEEVIRARQAAYRLYREAGRDLGAARMAMWLGKDYEDFRGELAVAQGWRQRARSLLEGEPVAPEHGWLPLLECWASLDHGEDPDRVRRLASEAMAVSRQLEDPDIGVLARAVEGLALVGQGKVQAGMKSLDEAAAAVLGGELRQEIWQLPVFCWLIYACERVRDFGRAAEWCERMREVADRMRHTASRGICRAHYAAVLISRGEWAEAESTLSEAAAWYEASWPPHAAEAHVRLAELRRRQGRAEEAEALLRRFEWHPLSMLGLAELALDAHRPATAAEFAGRFLRHVPEANRLARAPGLELVVRVAVPSDDRERAAQALAELEATADAVGTGPLRGAASFAGGVAARAWYDPDEARACFEDAVALFQRSGTPFEAARSRLGLADVLVSLERLGRAREEALAAQRSFDWLGAEPLRSEAEALVTRIDRRTETSEKESAASLLTPRQIEVLRLVSEGQTDREVASTLGISEHTVHRHMSNILLRLRTPTRAAAAMKAANAGLI